MTISSRTYAVVGLGALAVLAGCVSVEQAPLGKNVLQKGQRAVVIVYAAPSSYVDQEETKGGEAASLIPGLGLAVASADDDTALKASKDLQQYVPQSFDPQAAFQSALMTELARTPTQGKWVSASDAGLTPDVLGPLNAASDVVDWRHKYFDYSYTYEKPARDYSKFLTIDDALVFEVDLQYGVTTGDNDAASPNVSAVAHLYNADSMKLLWSDNQTAADAPGAKTMYDYKTAPQDLVARWQALAPQLAHTIASDFASSVMGQSSLPSGIDTSPMTTATSSGTASGLSLPAAAAMPGQPTTIAQPGMTQPGMTQPGQPGFTQPGQPVFAQPNQAPAVTPTSPIPGQ